MPLCLLYEWLFLKMKKKRNKKQKKYKIKEKDRINIQERKRVAIGFLLIVVAFSCLIFRVAYWQIVKADMLREKATNMQSEDTEISAKRGRILDCNKKVLAQTVTKYEVYLYTNDIYKKEKSKTKKRKTVEEISEFFEKDNKEIEEKLNSKINPVKISEGVSKKQIKKAQKKWGSAIYIKTKISRAYPNKTLSAHFLGGVTPENEGRTGIEYMYNEDLKGVSGRVVRRTDKNGNKLATRSMRYYSPKDGADLVTTIDEVIQSYVEEALKRGMRRTGAERITCLVMKPKTGEVLAMASSPTFDPEYGAEPLEKSEREYFKHLNVEAQNAYLNEMWKNPTITGVYEPGSTFKLITSSAAIDQGSANDKSKYECNTAINVDGVRLNCWSPVSHGTQNVKEAVGNSCNPALAKIALDMGKDNLYRYIDMYGLMDKTGIDLPSESISIIKNKDSDNFTNVDLATTGYGQGIAVTPIQLLTAINSLGNDGELMKPYVVKEIHRSKGKNETIKPEPVRQVVSKKTADKMREIMEYYISQGGGGEAYIPGYRVGGKTGTANIAKSGSYSKQTVASFVAMAPMDNPEISILVLVNKPSKGMFGASMAGPIVKEVLEKTLIYEGVERKYSKEEKESQDKNQAIVPDITGLNSGEAIGVLAGAGLKYKVVPDDGSNDSFYIQDQYPKAGAKIEKNGTVYMYSK